MKTVLILPNTKNKIEVLEDTQFVYFLSSGSKNNITDLTLEFVKEGVSAEIIALFSLHKGDSSTLSTITDHTAKNTSCSTLVKGVLYDFAESDYFGKIQIRKSGSQTASYLEEHVMILGENTKNNSKPTLEIETDDVKASHGSSTGRVNANQIYYLQARGFSKEQAIAEIAKGYLLEPINKILDEKIRKEVYNCFIGEYNE